MNAGRSLCDFFRSGALRVRELDGHPGEMTNALMAAHQQIDGVLGGLRLQGSERGNLIQHVTLLWRRKARAGDQGLGIRGWGSGLGHETKSDRRGAKSNYRIIGN